jgi:L-ascorbate metabolism protein UlaG (beta-lactamase superfamily)
MAGAAAHRSRAAFMERVTFVGHATVLIELGGARVLTDPLLRGWAGPLRRYAPPVDQALVSSPDVVLLSHMHIDHVDRGSLDRLDESATVLVPAAGRQMVESVGFRRVVVVSAGDRVRAGDVDIIVVPAHHDGRRHPLARDAEAVGYLITPAASDHSSHGVYFPGDTKCFDGMIGFAGAVDVVLMPVWGWGTSVDEDEHMTPLSAARCLSLLRPRIVIPIHWGTYAPPAQARLRGFDQMEPPRAFIRYAAHLEPDVEVRLLRPGETTTIERPDR